MREEKTSVENTKRLVLIFDSDALRAGKLREVFGMREALTATGYMKGLSLAFLPQNFVLGQEPDIVLIHARDKSTYEKASVPGQPLVIYYGGRGGNDVDIPTEAHRIMRPVLASEGCLTVGEAQELIEFASKREGELPAPLRSRRALPILRIVAMLCSTYVGLLAVEKIGTGICDQSFGEELDSAFASVGWMDLGSEQRRHFCSAAEIGQRHLQNLKSTGWWSDVLSSISQNWREAFGDEIVLARIVGLKEHEVIDQLITQICGTSNVEIDSNHIVRSFNALHDFDYWY